MTTTTDAKKERKTPALSEHQAATHALSEDLLPDAIPDGFECPILKDIMHDPVTTMADGHSYERDAIEAWFRQGRKKISPMTGAVLENTLLLPNHNLRKAIQHFLKKQPLLTQLKEKERQMKSQEQTLKDLELAIELHAQELDAQLRQKGYVTDSKPSATPAALQPAQLQQCVSECTQALEKMLRATPRSPLMFFTTRDSTAHYMSRLLTCFTQPETALPQLLAEPKKQGLTEAVARFFKDYLTQYPDLQQLYQHPALVKQLKADLDQTSNITLLIDKWRLSSSSAPSPTPSSSASSLTVSSAPSSSYASMASSSASSVSSDTRTITPRR